MDFTTIASVLAALLLAIPTIAAYFERQNRRTRRQNRQLQALTLEYKLHVFQLEQDLADQGVRPRPRPDLIRAVETDDDAEQGAGVAPAAGSPPVGGGAAGAAGAGSRHAAP